MKISMGDKFIVQGHEALLVYKNKDIVRLHIFSYPSSIKIYQVDDFISLVRRFIILKTKREILKRENLPSHLLRFQFAIIGKSTADMVIENKKVYDYQLPFAAYNSFRAYGIAMMKRVYKCNRKIAEENFDWFYKRFGMKIKY